MPKDVLNFLRHYIMHLFVSTQTVTVTKRSEHHRPESLHRDFPGITLTTTCASPSSGVTSSVPFLFVSLVSLWKMTHLVILTPSRYTQVLLISFRGNLWTKCRICKSRMFFTKNNNIQGTKLHQQFNKAPFPPSKSNEKTIATHF